MKDFLETSRSVYPVQSFKVILSKHKIVNPYNAEATFVQNTRIQSYLKTTLILPCWHSLDTSFRLVISDEYACARVSAIFQVFG